jgi:hypothetical protein
VFDEMAVSSKSLLASVSSTICLNRWPTASQLAIAAVLPRLRKPPAMASATGVADHFLVSHDPNAEEDGRKV